MTGSQMSSSLWSASGSQAG
ncbi:UNVERIFIED_CONTAM: hypothetical protein GTU68_023543 [Idotea baltica]|nr:hypothetical protein [Idotea baltica]